MDKRDVIDARCQMGEQIADPFSAFAVLVEIPTGLDDSTLILMTTPPKGFHVNRLIVTAFHRGLIVERIDMAGTAIHEQENDVLRFRSEMGGLGRQRILVADGVGGHPG